MNLFIVLMLLAICSCETSLPELKANESFNKDNINEIKQITTQLSTASNEVKNNIPAIIISCPSGTSHVFLNNLNFIEEYCIKTNIDGLKVKNGPYIRINIVNSSIDNFVDISGEYDNGKKTGIWEYYSSNNKIRSKGKFLKDFMDGDWIIYKSEKHELFCYATILNGNGDIFCDGYFERFSLNGKIYNNEIQQEFDLLDGYTKKNIRKIKINIFDNIFD